MLRIILEAGHSHSHGGDDDHGDHGDNDDH